MALARAR
jgi:hypothetical protein